MLALIAALAGLPCCKKPVEIPVGNVYVITVNGQVGHYQADGQTVINLNPQSYGNFSPGRVAVWTLNGDKLESQLYASYWGNAPGSFTPSQGTDYAVFVYPPAGVYQKMDNNAIIQMAQGKRFHSVGYKSDDGVTPPEGGAEFWRGVIDEANGFLSANGVVLLGSMDFNSGSSSGDLTVGFAKQNYNNKTDVRVVSKNLIKAQKELSENNTNMDDVLTDSTMDQLIFQYFYGYTQAK